MTPPRAFISFTPDTDQHCEAVREFAALLRENGIDVELDRGALVEADFVLVVASEGFRRADDHKLEASALRVLLQADRPPKVLLVILPGRKLGDLPAFLRGHGADHFLIPALTADGVDHLLRQLTRQPLSVSWRSELLPQGYEPRSPLVEVHLVPAGPAARHDALERTCDELATLGRSDGLFAPTQPLSAGSSAAAAWAYSADRQGGECGLAVVRDGQRTCWFPLPGAILDRADLVRQVSA